MSTKASTPMSAAQPCEPTDLPTLVRRFQTWRASRVRGQRIPAELWQAAIAVARIHGINPTVAALKLNEMRSVPIQAVIRFHRGEPRGTGVFERYGLNPERMGEVSIGRGLAPDVIVSRRDALWWA